MKHLIVCAAASLSALAAPAFAQVVPPSPAGQAPTGGVYDPGTAAPTPGIDGNITGRSEVNAGASDCYSQTKLSETCERLAQARNRDLEQNRDWHQTDESDPDEK